MLIVVGLDRVLEGHGGVSRVVEPLMILRGEDEHHGEWHPPDQIVGDDGPDELDWQFAGDQRCIDEADRAEDFPEEPNENDGPVCEGITGGDEVPDAVDPDDHAYALPDRGVCGAGQVHDGEERRGEKDHPGAPEDVVKPSEDEGASEPGGHGLLDGAGLHGWTGSTNKRDPIQHDPGGGFSCTAYRSTLDRMPS